MTQTGFEKFSNWFLRWPSLAGLSLVSALSIVGLGPREEQKNPYLGEPKTVEINPDGPNIESPPELKDPNFGRNKTGIIRQIVDAPPVRVINQSTCKDLTTLYANAFAKNGLANPRTDTLRIPCEEQKKPYKKTIEICTGNQTGDAFECGPYSPPTI